MNRVVFIIVLCLSGFVFTQCGDDCGRNSRWGKGSNSFSSKELVGIERFDTDIGTIQNSGSESDYKNLQIELIIGLEYALNIPKPSFINRAYACSPPPIPQTDVSSFIDSIKVYSEPDYIQESEVTSLLRFSGSFSLKDYNDSSKKPLIATRESVLINSPPTQSDSFTFSFYYYKDGAIIDSSFTQNYYISE